MVSLLWKWVVWTITVHNRFVSMYSTLFYFWILETWFQDCRWNQIYFLIKECNGLCISFKQFCNILHVFVDKPDMLSIKPEPQLLNGKLTVTEWETIGPYHCSADCNPPCSITWEYKNTDGTIHDASSNGKVMGVKRVNRSISLHRCTAIYEQKHREKQVLELDIQCKYSILFFIVLFYWDTYLKWFCNSRKEKSFQHVSLSMWTINVVKRS